MQRWEGGDLGLDQGSVLLFSDFADGGPMWTGSGPREVRRTVPFTAPFLSPPRVILGITLWDVDHTANMRGDLDADRIDYDAFDIVFRTWGDTRLARLRVAWTAFGPLPSSDRWDV